MRDLLVVLIVFGAIPFIVMRPHIGVLIWSWIGYMNPHRLAYGFAYSFPFAQVTAVVTLISMTFGVMSGREKFRIPMTPVTGLLILFVFWITVSSFAAVEEQPAMYEWERVLKIQLIIFVTLMLMNSKERLVQLVWAIVISIGFFSVKGGLFAIQTAGQYRVWGPVGSFIEGNNELALAVIMVLPLMRFLQLQLISKWAKNAMLLSIGLSLVAILVSYSRGAFLALIAISAFMIWKSRRRLLFGTLFLLAGAILLVFFLPEQWFDRMGTIQAYDQDESAEGRIVAWRFALMYAADHPFLGGGFGVFTSLHRLNYQPELPMKMLLDAHSIYFEVLGEQGVIGLLLFLSIFVLAYRTGSWVIKNASNHPDLIWARDLAAMVQVSLVGYAVGGMFLGLAYFDLPYHLVCLVVMAKELVKKQLSDIQNNLDEHVNDELSENLNLAETNTASNKRKDRSIFNVARRQKGTVRK